MKLSSVEIGKLSAAYPYLRRHVDLPAALLRAIGRGEPPKIGRREVGRLVAALMTGPKRVALSGDRFLIGGRHGPGRPPGIRFAHARGSAADSRGHAMSPKRRAAQQLQGKYMGTLAGLSAAQRPKVKKARAVDGYAAAFKLAAKLNA